MENNGNPENQPGNSRQDLLVPLMIVAFLAVSWFVYTYVNRNWLDAFDQVLAWIKNPSVTYTSVPIAGVPLAFLATLEILFLGVTAGYLLLNNEKDLTLKPSLFSGLVEALPTAVGHGLPGQGHLPHLAQPALVNRIILDFLSPQSDLFSTRRQACQSN